MEVKFNNHFTTDYDLASGDGLSGRVVNYLLRQTTSWKFGEPIVSGNNFETVRRVLYGHWPNFDPDKPGMVTVWLDQKARDKGRAGRTVMKYGKFLRKLFPALEDSLIEKLVDDYKKKFDPPAIEIVESWEESGFTEAYAGEIAPFRNLHTSFYRKSLANSCMRGNKFEHLPKHPACAYASGEFSVVYAKDKNNGNIHGRCVVWHESKRYSGEPIFAPIYGVCEDSINAIETYMEEKGYIRGDSGDWVNASLKAIPYENGFIAPYLDLAPQNLEHDGRFLNICENGDIDAEDYSGVLTQGTVCHCDNCGTRVTDDESWELPDSDIVCESCYNELTVFSEYAQERIFRDDAVEVNLLNGDTDWMYERRGCIYVPRLGQWWEEDAVYSDAYGNFFTFEEMEDGEWVECTWTYEFFPSNEISYTTDDEPVETQSLKDDPSWQLNEDGKWEMIQGILELEKTNAA